MLSFWTAKGRRRWVWACLWLSLLPWLAGCVTAARYITVTDLAGRMGGVAKTDWKTNTVTVSSSQRQLILTPGTQLVIVDHQPVRLADPVKYQGGILIVPEEILRWTPPRPATVTPAPSLPIPQKGKTVVVDAGHGGDDFGATRGGLREKELNLAIAEEVKRGLTAAGYTVKMTRSGDVAMGLTDRSEVANSSYADAFVSIHANSSTTPTVQGIEVFFHDGSSTAVTARSKRLAETIHSAVVSATGDEARGVKENRYVVLRTCQSPAVLVEVGFLSNDQTRLQLATTGYRKKIADAVVRGIEDYFRGVP